MAKSSFVVRVLLKGKDDGASKAIGQTERSVSKLSTSLKVGLAAAAAGALLALRSLVRGFRDAITAAQVQEDAVRSLDAALGSLGPAAAKVSKELQEQAAALEKVTRFGDEAIIGAQGFLATLGVTAEQLPQATQATVDLAAALGVSLTEAARNVGKTVGGFAGELGEVIPELKNLDTAALQAGEGIALLGDKFAGRALEDAKTFSGAMAQLSNAFGTLQEQVGESVTKNAGVRKSFQDITTVLQSNGAVQAVDALIVSFAGLVTIVASVGSHFNRYFLGPIGDVIGAIGAFVISLDKVEISASALEFTARGAGISVAELKVRLDEAGSGAHEVSTKVDAVGDAAERAALKTAALGGAMGQASAATQKLATVSAEGRKQIESFGKALADAATEAETMIGATISLGEVTSVQLAGEIREITEELESQAIILHDIPNEYVRLERIAADKIESLRERIQSLRDGLGDTTQATRDAARGFDDYGASARNAGLEVDLFTSSQDRAANSTRNLQQQTRGGLSSGLSGSSFPTTIGGGTFTTYIPFSRVGPGGAVQA